MDRREFTLQLTSIPMVYGAWRLWGGRTRREAGPEPLKEAVEEMRRTERIGLVFVLPKDTEARMSLGQGLFRLHMAKPWPEDGEVKKRISHRNYPPFRRESLSITSSCVLICLEADEAEAALGTQAPRVIIDQDARVLRQLDSVPADVQRGMLKRLSPLVHGADFEHLNERGRRARARLSPERLAEFQEHVDAIKDYVGSNQLHLVPSEHFEAHQTTILAFVQEIPALIHSLAAAVLPATAPLETGLEYLLKRWTRSLPHGAVMPEFRSSSCLRYREVKPDEVYEFSGSTVACGMPSLTSIGGRFLRFVGDA